MGPAGGMGRPGIGGLQPGMKIPGMAEDPGSRKGPAQELKIDPNTLPENYSPPPATKDEIMTKEVKLAEQDEIDKLKKDLAKYQNALRKPVATDAEKLLIRNGIRYRLAVMCLAKNRPDLTKLHDDLLRDMASVGAVPEGANPVVVKSFRQMVLQELLNQAAPLLPDQNFYVRLHITILLGELDLTKEDPKLNFKLEAFAPPADPLVKVILDGKQPEAVKVAAVNGLVRILRLGNPNVGLRTKVAEGIVAELKRKDTHPWYQMRLAGALSVVDIDLDQAKKPFIVDILKAILADPDADSDKVNGRTWAVKAEAAKSLGRVPLPAAANPPSVTRAVAVFALTLAKAAQQKPQSKAEDPKWKSEFIKVYLAFQQLDEKDLMADKKTKSGLMNNPAAAAKSAYDLIVPMVAAILHGQRLTVQQVQNLEAYVGPVAQQPAAASDGPAAAGPPNNKVATDTKTETKTDSKNTALGASGPKNQE